jgi:secreted trypsin-like serine protease
VFFFNSGPAIWKDKKDHNRAYVIGIVSHGKHGCKVPTTASVFSRVTTRLDWIKSQGSDIKKCLKS